MVSADSIVRFLISRQSLMTDGGANFWQSLMTYGVNNLAIPNEPIGIN